jgi:hypothetical protein
MKTSEAHKVSKNTSIKYLSYEVEYSFPLLLSAFIFFYTFWTHIHIFLKRKFKWIGHTLRKEDGEISKAALLCNPQGSRKRGRLKNSWRRSVIKEAGRSWKELRFLAADRQKWVELIDNLCS